MREQSDGHRISGGHSEPILQPAAIYPALADHQRNEAWQRRDLMAALQAWAEHLNAEFKLGVPEIALRLDPLPVSCPGQFRKGHNGFGLKGEIAVNTLYLTEDRPPSDVIATLLFLMLQAWQQAHGTPAKGNHRNTELRDKARSLGLIVDRNGIVGLARQGALAVLMERHGVAVPEAEAASIPKRRPGRSKLKKWTCGCTNIRVAVPDFQGLCLKCRQMFCPDETGRPSRLRPSDN